VYSVLQCFAAFFAPGASESPSGCVPDLNIQNILESRSRKTGTIEIEFITVESSCRDLLLMATTNGEPHIDDWVRPSYQIIEPEESQTSGGPKGP